MGRRQNTLKHSEQWHASKLTTMNFNCLPGNLRPLPYIYIWLIIVYKWKIKTMKNKTSTHGKTKDSTSNIWDNRTCPLFCPETVRKASQSDRNYDKKHEVQSDSKEVWQSDTSTIVNNPTEKEIQQTNTEDDLKLHSDNLTKGNLTTKPVLDKSWAMKGPPNGNRLVPSRCQGAVLSCARPDQANNLRLLAYAVVWQAPSQFECNVLS